CATPAKIEYSCTRGFFVLSAQSGAVQNSFLGGAFWFAVPFFVQTAIAVSFCSVPFIFSACKKTGVSFVWVGGRLPKGATGRPISDKEARMWMTER
ncbi:hypothetical protein, partial [uncultured Subdoligranulum sp.]|uniref:hypothetical protein n=1 Tax=uncultured Subdoligranulum sp. TaxID=512298 RepID=UPI0025FA3C82